MDNNYKKNNISYNLIDDEVVTFPTVAVVTHIDRKRYSNIQKMKSLKECVECRILYDGYKYNSCPLCDIKKKYIELTNKIEKTHKIEELCKKDDGKKYKRGDVIRLGEYEGDAIEWIVLKVENDKILILSKCILDVKQYHIKFTRVTWERSSMRNFLNNDFFNECFTHEEKIKILNTKVEKHGALSMGEGYDKIFCLSVNEAKEYFSSDMERMAMPTQKVEKKVNIEDRKYFVDAASGGGNWWLRTPGNNGTQFAAYVRGSGWINEYGDTVSINTIGIRPALWLKIT